ncbi:sensor histidine kinase [Caldimonas tepidiphila]|uniref:sensor histidine kinase n=1 Tax=Caldimonas tepidiphila TaxID=2315841 RepID=UPI001475D23F|nr:ATP-binding protein [Caldimonas tepidiphila]
MRALLLLPLLLLLGLWLPGGIAAAHAAAVRLDAALLTDHTAPDPRPREVALPDSWEFSAPGRDGRASYRFALPDEALREGQPVLFLRRVGNVFRVRLNGQPVLEVGRELRPLPNYGQEPHLVRLPRALLEASGNELVIDVIGEPRREAGLSRVWVGPEHEVRPMFERAENLQVLGGWVVSAVCATIAVVAVLVALRTRQPAYGWFAAANLIWAWRVTALSAHEPVTWPGLQVWFFQLSYSLFVASLMMFCARMMRPEGRTHIGRPMLIFVALSVLLASGNWWLNLPLLRTLLLLLILGVVSACTLVLARIAWRERSLSAALLSVCAATAVAVGARDWVVFRLLHDYDAYTWARFVTLPLVAVLTWLLVADYARILQQLRELARTQQATIEAKERELQQAFELRRDHERRQAALDERDRILREMHDGLGGRLVGAIALARHLDAQPAAPPAPQLVAELRHTLDDCLIELRLALDSLEVDERSLGEALAEMRFRVEPSLRAAGVRLVWDVDDGAMDLSLPGADTLHVLRIVREALTNVIKHAGATMVRLSLKCSPGQVELQVLDNGAPPPLAPGAESASGMPSGRRGLASMQLRAQSLGGRLTLGPQPLGWAVTLQLPLAQGDAQQRAA